jgi:hypothetical protein
MRDGVRSGRGPLTLIRTDDDKGSLRRINAQEFISMAVAIVIALVVVIYFVQV